MKKLMIIGLLGFVAPQAEAFSFDLTGTWIGTQVCDDLVDGVPENFVLTDNLLEISQDGQNIRMKNFGLLYEGVAQKIAGGPTKGEAVVSVCGGNFEAQEIVRIKRIRTGGPGAGSWDAESIFQSDAVPGSIGEQDFSTCKWAYERISTDDPNVPACN